ncbi:MULTISPECIES: STAS-like domain-containing protein [Pseudoalteromonas]
MKPLKEIEVVKDFFPRPKWRYRKEGKGSGQEFREDYLTKALQEYTKVKVDLTGYNRYGPSFISEAFGGLIRESDFTLNELEERLTIEHELLPSVIEMCWVELREADKEMNGE